MIPVTEALLPLPVRRFSHEIAAAVTLRPAAAALVAPNGTPPPALVATACAALVTRLTLITFLADPDDPAASAIRLHDPFADPVPDALHGLGPTPDRARLERAGDRCVDAWRSWSAGDAPDLDRRGVAGALGVAAWCSWALGQPHRAVVRAGHALDVSPTDPLAGLVRRTCDAGVGPAWAAAWRDVPR